MRAIFAAAGITYKDFARTEYLPFGESVELMKSRQLDATLLSVGLGAAAIKDLANAIDMKLVAIPADVVKKIGSTPTSKPGDRPVKPITVQSVTIQKQ